MPNKTLFLRTWAHLSSSPMLWVLVMADAGLVLIKIPMNFSVQYLFFLIAQVFVSIMSMATLIGMVYAMEHGKRPGILQVFRSVLPHFWRLVGLSIIVAVPSLFLVFPMCAVSVSGKSLLGGVIGNYHWNFILLSIVFDFFTGFQLVFFYVKITGLLTA